MHPDDIAVLDVVESNCKNVQVKYSVAAIQAKPIEVILTQPYIKLGLGSATTTQA